MNVYLGVSSTKYELDVGVKEISMVIKKVEPSDKLENIMEEEQERYEALNGVVYNFTPFSFAAKEGDEIMGAITGFTCYAEVYIDELVVMEKHRGKTSEHN